MNRENGLICLSQCTLIIFRAKERLPRDPRSLGSRFIKLTCGVSSEIEGCNSTLLQWLCRGITSKCQGFNMKSTDRKKYSILCEWSFFSLFYLFLKFSHCSLSTRSRDNRQREFEVVRLKRCLADRDLEQLKTMN